MSHLTFKNHENIVVLNTNLMLLVGIIVIYFTYKWIIWENYLIKIKIPLKLKKILNKLIYVLHRIIFFILKKNTYTVKISHIYLLWNKDFSFKLTNYYIKLLYKKYINLFNKIWLPDKLKKARTVSLNKLLKLRKKFSFKIIKNQIDVDYPEDVESFNIKPQIPSESSGIKLFIRNSKCFNKTKYSFIRQECKNIVYLTLMINILVIIIALNTYMHWRFINFYTYSFIIIYTLFYIKYLLKFKSIYKKILRMYYQVKKKPLD